MPGINLLPQELKPKGYALKASKSLRQFAILSIVILFLALIGFTVISVFLSIQNRSLANKEESLKNDIKSLEQTEQKLVLIQNRLAGIDKIVSNGSAREEIEILETIIEKNPQNISIVGAKIDSNQLIVSIEAADSSSLTGFYSLLINSNFKYIELDSFNYDSANGYKVDIAISK